MSGCISIILKKIVLMVRDWLICLFSPLSPVPRQSACKLVGTSASLRGEWGRRKTKGNPPLEGRG